VHRRPALGRALGAAVLALLAFVPAGARAQQPSPIGIDMEDNFFCAAPIQVPVGATVEWTNEGRSPHTATADGGSFDSGNVLGVSLAAPTWWSLLLSTFAYVLPLVLYVAWVSIAIWDLIRQESESTRRRLWWMVVILIVPFIGPLLYFAFGRSPIPGSLRLMLTAWAFLIYVAIAALAIVIGGS
jgi:plastocyanin